MAKPIRIMRMEFDPQANLSPEKFAEYEQLDKRLDQLTEGEKRKYERLILAALVQYTVSLESLDQILTSSSAS